MILKTEGIVLRSLKHQDSNVIVTLYTADYGIRSFIIKAYRTSRSRSRHSYFQPLSIVDIVFLHKENRSLQKITESRLSSVLQEVQTHPIKLSMGLAMMEIVFDTVKEEEENAPLYQFIKNSILFLDQSPRKQVNIFIYFILHLTRYLGFLPNDESEAAQKVDFDIRRGTIRASQHNDATAHLLRRFLHTDLENCQEITFDQTNKRFLIKTIFDYYQEHIQGFRYPQTLKVFSEVFE